MKRHHLAFLSDLMVGWACREQLVKPATTVVVCRFLVAGEDAM